MDQFPKYNVNEKDFCFVFNAGHIWAMKRDKKNTDDC